MACLVQRNVRWIFHDGIRCKQVHNFLFTLNKELSIKNTFQHYLYLYDADGVVLKVKGILCWFVSGQDEK